jgi:hypothetical protein
VLALLGRAGPPAGACAPTFVDEEGSVTVRPVSKPILSHDEENQDSRTVWWCSDCQRKGVDPDTHDCKGRRK